LIYGGGYFITGYVQTNTTAVFYLAKKADPTGAWTTGINTNEYGGGGYVGTISYEPTTALFVIQGMYYDGSWLQCWLTSSSNLSTFNRAYQSSSEYVKTKCIQYYNGTWYGVHTTTGNGDGLVSASTLAGLGASSAGTKVSSLPSSYTLYGRVNGLWIALAGTDLYVVSADPFGAWTKYSAITSGGLSFVDYQGGAYVGFSGSSTNFYYVPRAVPNISIAGAYAFIKALA
jgi:hypothetical protein